MQWLNLYDMESESYDLLETVRDTYYLVAIIDNDFISANKELGSPLWSTMLEVANVHERLLL